MKALSVRQPWASCIANGEKTIECRTWKTKYRGELLICASGRKFTCEDGLILPAGVAVAVVELVNVRPMTKDDVQAAALGNMEPEDLEEVLRGLAWELRLKFPVVPFPVKGKLNLFNVDTIPQPLPPEYDDHLNYLCKTQGVADT